MSSHRSEMVVVATSHVREEVGNDTRLLLPSERRGLTIDKTWKLMNFKGTGLVQTVEEVGGQVPMTWWRSEHLTCVCPVKSRAIVTLCDCAKS